MDLRFVINLVNPHTSFEVHNPEHVSCHVKNIQLDGESLNDLSIPLGDNQKEHRVVVTMGNKS